MGLCAVSEEIFLQEIETERKRAALVSQAPASSRHMEHNMVAPVLVHSSHRFTKYSRDQPHFGVLLPIGWTARSAAVHRGWRFNLLCSTIVWNGSIYHQYVLFGLDQSTTIVWLEFVTIISRTKVWYSLPVGVFL